MTQSIIGETSAFDVFKLKDAVLVNDAGEWGQEPDENAVGVLRSTNFTNEGYLITEDIAYRTVSESKKNEKLLIEGDIIIERSGGSNTQPVGRVGYINKTISNNGFVFANFIQRIRLDKDIFNPKFTYFCLQQMYEMGVTTSMQFQTTGIRNLDYKYYLKSKLPKPTIKEQKAISDILFKVDEAIEAVEKSIKAAEKLKKSLMQNLLTGKLKPDGTWRNETEFYLDEKFGKVPKGWIVSKVKDFGTVYTGKTPPTAESKVFAEETLDGYPFITPGDLGGKKYIVTAERYVTEKGISYSYRLPAGTVCVVCIGSTIGKIGITKVEACTNQQINSLIPNEDNSSEFFYYMMLFRYLHFKEIAGVNATPQINKSGFNKYKILRPIDKVEQIQIANKIAVIDNEILQEYEKIQLLKNLKKSLMQNLLTGKVRVDMDQINSLLEGE